MPREVISTSEAPEYPSYSQAVKVAHDLRCRNGPESTVATG